MATAAVSEKSLEALERLEKFWCEQKPDVSPEGSFTVSEAAKHFQLSIKAAGHRLTTLVSQGVLVKVYMRLPDAMNRLVRTAVYIPKEKNDN